MANEPATDNPTDNEPPVTVIQPRGGWHLVDLHDLWQYRELLWILALRDLKVRYKQTVVGALWAVVQPVAMMVVFTLLFKATDSNPVVEGVPYPVSLYTAMLPWHLFANSLRSSSESLVSNQRLITKVYFPRVLVPVAPVMTSLVDFAIAFVVLIGLMIGFGVAPTWGLLAVPLFIALAVAATLSMGIWLSALNALYRDVRYAVPFLIQIGMFVSPVVYDLSKIPEQWQWLYSLNPMVGVIEGMRWAVLGATAPPVVPLALSVLITLALTLIGLAYFRRVERTIADRV